MFDSLHEECGVMGVFGDAEATQLCFLGLHALQHRGQEAFGIASYSKEQGFATFKAFGLVGDNAKSDGLSNIEGNSSIGHVRYSTFGGKDRAENIQPFVFKTSRGTYALCHNGNLTNADLLRQQLEVQGSIFHSTSDTEIFMHLLAKSRADDILQQLFLAMSEVKGAYSLLLSTHDRLFALRDPFGFRPLVLGQRQGAWVVASESCALDLIEADFVREIEPGEVVEISESGLTSHRAPIVKPAAFCSFEPIYFSRPDSRLGPTTVYSLRKKIGMVLAQESKVDADLVMAIPDSGVAMALGFAQEAGITYETALVRSHYVGRTFIEPSQSIRDFGVKLKLSPVRSVLQDRRIIVVDDSIVRGTTSIKIVRMLKAAGAKEVHLRIGSPPITHSCFFGVDTPDRQNLAAAQKTVSEMRTELGCESLAFLSIEGLKKSLDGSSKGFCFGCFSGQYPEDICRKVSPQPTDLKGPGLRA